jgi:hypothetical protein
MTTTKTKSRRDRKAASSGTRNDSHSELTLAERREVQRYGAYADGKILAKLSRAERREVERRTFEPDTVQRQLHKALGDASSGGAYFMHQVERLRTLAGVLAPLIQDLRDQADDLRWKLKEIEPLVHPRSRTDRGENP